ncbi:MAG TPA: hypothetical protein VF100_07915 [Thermoanaerobaculia bacterium]
MPQTTDRLTVAQRHLDLVLELPYPKTTAAGMALPGLDRVEVWEARRPVPPAGPDARPTAGATDAGAAEEATAAAGEAGAPGDEPGAAAEPAPASSTAPPPLDPRQFTALAELRTELAGAALSAAVIGERIVITLPLGPDFPAVPVARYFAVRTVAAGDDRSEMSNQAVIVPRPPPAAPRGVAAEAGPGGVRLVWQGDGPAVTGYDVYRRGAQERTFLDPLARLEAGAAEYFDDTARFGERYIYGVAAVAAREPTIASAVGSTVEVDYRDRFPPAAPGGLVALVEEGRVRLVWEAAEAADLAGYRVSRAAAGEGFRPVGDLVTAAEWVDESVVAGTVYTWRVASVDASGNRSEAAEVTAEAR